MMVLINTDRIRRLCAALVVGIVCCPSLQAVHAAVLPLSSLNGTNGFRLDGVAAGDESGTAVSIAGDINGDGIADLVIGALLADPNGDQSGSSYVVFGRMGGFAPSIQLSSLNGQNGFRLDGVAEGDLSGRIAGAGDINGDGVDDLIIGAQDADPNGNSSGSSYVVFGRKTTFAAVFQLSSLDGTNGFRLDGAAETDVSGRAVSAIGDVNGDGFDDVIVGARTADPNGNQSGSSYVVFGRSSGFSPAIELSSLDGNTGFRLDGVSAGDFSGFSVSGGGDINGDDLSDFIIGAFGADLNGNDSGSSYVLFGRSTGFVPIIELSSLDGNIGFRLDGVSAGDRTGFSVSGTGDVNGDGLGDLVIGADLADINAIESGGAYVVFGTAVGGFASNIQLSSLDGVSGFRLEGVMTEDIAGFAVSSGGDLNGDGVDDLIIGAPLADPNGNQLAGSSYVVFGRKESVTPSMQLSALDGRTGFRIDGVSAGDRSASAVAGGGDINGDGIDDLVIGASLADPNGVDSGSSYVIFGSSRFFDVIFQNGLEDEL